MAKTAALNEDENYKNYGSVDLGLSPEWRREDQEITLISNSLVGHDGGKSDAFLSDDPRARHQFAWAEIGDKVFEALKKRQGYAYVTDGAWTINESLWRWEADEKAPTGPRYCVNFNDRLMARPEALWLADQERRKRRSANITNKIDAELAQKHPGVGFDQDGVALRPITRQ